MRVGRGRVRVDPLDHLQGRVAEDLRDKDVRRLEDKIDALCAAVEQLQSSVTPAAKNGRSRTKAAVEH